MAGQKIGDAFIDIGARFDKLNKGLKQTTSKIESGFSKLTPKLDKQFVNLGKTFAAAFATREIINFTTEAVKLAATAEGVERAFNRLNDPALLSNLQKATKGTVSELELMKQAVQAKNLGVPIKNLASLFEFATQRAADTGESVDHLVQSIVTGIGRKSPLILDNLGISAIDLKKQLNGVGLETATVGDIAEAVGKIASKSMANIGDASLTAAQRIAQATANIDNMKVEIGEQLIPVISELLTFLNKMMKGVKVAFASDQVQAWANEIYDSGNAAQWAADNLSRLNRLQKEGRITQEQQIGQIKKYIESEKNRISAAQKARKEAQKTMEWAGRVTQVYKEADKANNQNAIVIAESTRKVNEYNSALNSLTATQNANTTSTKAANKEIDKTAMKYANLQGEVERIMRQAPEQEDQSFGIIPEFEEEGEVFEDLDKFNHKMQQAAINQQLAAGAATGFGMALTESFAGALSGGENFFVSMGEYIKQLIIKLAAAAAAAFLLNSLLGGTGLVAGGFKGLFGQFSGLGGGGGFNGGLDFGGVLRGNDIFLSNQRQGTTNNRFGG